MAKTKIKVTQIEGEFSPVGHEHTVSEISDLPATSQSADAGVIPQAREDGTLDPYFIPDGEINAGSLLGSTPEDFMPAPSAEPRALDEVFYESGWKLKSQGTKPGLPQYDTATGAGGIITIVVRQATIDEAVSGWELVHADAGATSPTGLLPFFSTSGIWDIPAASSRKVWVRAVRGTSVGDWLEHAAIDPGTNSNYLAPPAGAEDHDRLIYVAGTGWVLESDLPDPGPVEYISVSGSNGVISVSVRQLDPDEVVEGWELCHAADTVTDPTGFPSVFEKGVDGAKFLIASNAPRNVWVRAVTGGKRGPWQGYGTIPSGESQFESVLADPVFTDGTPNANYTPMTAIYGGGIKYCYEDPPTFLMAAAGYMSEAMSLFAQAGTVRHSAIGGQLDMNFLMGCASDGRHLAGAVLLARSEIFTSYATESYYELFLECDDVGTAVFRLVAVVNGVPQTIATSSNIWGYGTWGSPWFSLRCFLRRINQTFSVVMPDGTVIFTVTDSTILADDNRVFVGMYQRTTNDGYNRIYNPLNVDKANYAGALIPVNPGSFIDPALEGNATGSFTASRYMRRNDGNTLNSDSKVRFDNNLEVIAERFLANGGALQETVFLSRLILSPKTITVKPSGGDFTTLQAAWNYLKGKTICAAVTIAVDPGTWAENLSLTDQPFSSFITLQGDTRADAGRVFTTTGGITKAGNDITATLTETPPADFGAGDYVAFGGNTTSAGNIGRFPIVSINTGAKTVTFTNAAGTAETPTLGKLQMCSNRILASTGSAWAHNLVVTACRLTVTGFTFLNTNTAGYAVYAAQGAIITLSKAGAYAIPTAGFYSEATSEIWAGATVAVIGCAGQGFQAGWMGIIFCGGALAANCGIGIHSGYGGLVQAASTIALKNTTGFYATDKGYTYASGVNSLVSGNGTNYSPGTSGVPGNNDAVINWS